MSVDILSMSHETQVTVLCMMTRTRSVGTVLDVNGDQVVSLSCRRRSQGDCKLLPAEVRSAERALKRPTNWPVVLDDRLVADSLLV